MDNRYSINDVIRQDVENILMGLYTTIPAIVQSYNANTQTVNVLVAVETPTQFGGNIPPATYNDIPVIFPASSDWVIAGPIEEGDSVVLLAPHYGTEEYFSGNKDKVGKPTKVIRHDLNDAVAVVGMFTSNSKTIKDAHKDKFHIAQGDNVITFDNSGGIEITNNNNSVKIIPNGNIEIENGAKITMTQAGTVTMEGDVVITGSLTVNGINFSTHIHPYTDNGNPLFTSPPVV